MQSEKKEYQSFIDQYGGYALSVSDFPDWKDRVERSNYDFHAIFDDTSIEETIQIKNSVEPLSPDRTNFYHAEICKIDEELFPGKYKKMYRGTFIGRNHFSLMNMWIDGRERKTPKFIRQTFVKRIKVLKDSEHFIFQGEDKEKECIQKLDALLSQLSDEFTSNSSSSCEMKFKMSVEPKAFYRLGHYGVDAGSCFHQECECEDNKYSLAQTPRTFVLLVDKNGTRIARYWGFFSETLNTVYICNGYYGPGIHEGTIKRGMTAFFTKVLKKQTTFFQAKVIVHQGIYHNRAPDWGFTVDPKEIGKRAVLMPRTEGLSARSFCYNCGDGYHADDMTEVNSHGYCNYCLDEIFTICDDCSEYTPNGEIEITQDGWRVCETCLSMNYTRCDSCREAAPDREVTNIEQNSWCDDCVNQYSGTCGDCGQRFENSNLNSDCICSDCEHAREEESEYA